MPARLVAAALASATLWWPVTPAVSGTAKRPRLLGYRYFPPVPGHQAAFEVDALDPNAQVVGARLSGDVEVIADGGCGLGGRKNGDPTHFRVPIRPLPDGERSIVITLTSSTCRLPVRVEKRSERVTLHLPTDAGTDTHARCDSPTAERLVRAFARALSRGDARGAERLWAPEPGFQWYSTSAPGERLRAAAKDRASLLGYLRARAARHERIGIRRLTASYEARRDVANFHGNLRRRADDLAPTSYGFKGAASCVGGRPRLIVWSMAAHAPATR